MALQTYISNNNNVQIIIGGFDYTPYVLYDSIRVNNNVVMTSDTCELTIVFNPNVDKMVNAITGALVPVARPKSGMEIIWQNPKLIVTAPDNTQQPYREFGGVVVEVEETDDQSNLIYQVHGKSYEHWFNRHEVVGWWQQDKPENIIKSIVNTYCPGFTTYNVQNTNVTVIPQYFDYRRPLEAIKTIADQLEYGVYVDNYKDVHFYSIESITSPLPGNTLQVDTDLTNYGDLLIKENGEQQFNRIFIKGFKTRSKNYMVLTFTADGNTTQWSCGYRISSQATDVSVQVYSSISAYNTDATNFANGSPAAGVAMTIKRDMADGTPDAGGDSNTCYVHYSQNLIRIPNYNATNKAVPNAYVVAIRFKFMQDTIFLAQDPAAQSTTAKIEGTDGVYEYTYTDKSLTNSTISAVQSKGQLLLMKYKFPQLSGSFVSYMNNGTSQGWRAGQYFTLVSNRRFGGLNQIMFIQSVNKQIVKNDSNGLITQYTINFADSPYLV